MAFEPVHTLRPDLHRQLIGYSRESWNAYEAVYRLQQVTALLPLYSAELRDLYGPAGVGEARRLWGAVADVVSAMLDVPSTMESLVELGFSRAQDVGHVILRADEFTLAGSPILQRLDLAGILEGNGDLAPVLRVSVAHDAVAAPLLHKFQDELHAYDTEVEYLIHEALSDGEAEPAVTNVRDLVRDIEDVPDDFPEWDDRPLFLEEQKMVLDYLIKSIGVEIVAHNLIDDQLGRVLLHRAGAIVVAKNNNSLEINSEMVPANVARRPLELVCHQAGHAVLSALNAFDPQSDVLEHLYIVEMAVWNELGVDITEALTSTREHALERHLRSFDDLARDVVATQRAVEPVRPYEFPEF